MGRRIVWTEYESTDVDGKIDGYFDRLLKYIPSDVVGLWLTGSGLIQSQASNESRLILLWVLFFLGFIFSYFWMIKQTESADESTPWRQVILSCVSYAVWVFAIGGPFLELSWYEPLQGSLLLLIYTTAIPLLPAPTTEST